MTISVRERLWKFCEAYYLGDAHTFCDPDTGDLVSATYEVRAFANVLLNGPLMDSTDEVDARIEAAVAAERERCAEIADLHAEATLSFAGSETEAARLCARSIATAIRDPRVHSGGDTAPETQDE